MSPVTLDLGGSPAPDPGDVVPWLVAHGVLQPSARLVEALRRDLRDGFEAAALVVYDPGAPLQPGETDRVQLVLAAFPTRIRVTLWGSGCRVFVSAAGSERSDESVVDWSGLPPGPVTIAVRSLRVGPPCDFAWVARAI